MVKLVLMQIVADVVVDVGDASMCQQLAHVRSDYRKFTDLGFQSCIGALRVAQKSAKYALNLAPRTWLPNVKLLQFVFCISVDAESI